LERAGTAPHKGSVTGLFTVLVEGDDMDDPIADAARSILDGHIVLSRKIAQKNHFPAIDILQSTSRVMRSVISKEQIQWSGQVMEWLALYAQVEDLINIGAYTRGSNLKIDQAVEMIDKVNAFLKQRIDEPARFSDALAALHSLSRAGEAILAASQQQGVVAQPQRTVTDGMRF
jgi:flagellum-specific ATP synthase